MKLSTAFQALLASLHTSSPRPNFSLAIPLSGERLTVRRHQRMRDGYVCWPSRPALPARMCRISDTSHNGACIEIDGEPPDPELWSSKTLLFIASDNQEVACGLIWQKGRHFGLHFEGKPQPPSRSYA